MEVALMKLWGYSSLIIYNLISMAVSQRECTFCINVAWWKGLRMILFKIHKLLKPLNEMECDSSVHVGRVELVGGL